jgi:hypothetical protein
MLLLLLLLLFELDAELCSALNAWHISKQHIRSSSINHVQGQQQIMDGRGTSWL